MTWLALQVPFEVMIPGAAKFYSQNSHKQAHRVTDGGWRVTIWTDGLHQIKKKYLVKQQSSK